MNVKITTLLILSVFGSNWFYAQSIATPPNFLGPIYFDSKGQLLTNPTGANFYRIYRPSNPDEKLGKQHLGINGVLTFKNNTENLYFYFEDHFITGETLFQGNMRVSKLHQDQGLGLNNSLKVHLKGECRWYHRNGQLAQVGVYDGESVYGDQKQFDNEGKLIKSTSGLPLIQYDYALERTVLGLKNFSYGENGKSAILPVPQSNQAKNKEVIDTKPTDLAAKLMSMPRFPIRTYRPYLGLYQGKTINTTTQKSSNTSLEIIQFIEKKEEVVVELYWFGGFEAHTKLTGSIHDNVIFARGDWEVNGERVGIITLATFLQKEEGKLEGFFNIKLLDPNEKVQSCSFKLSKE